MGSPAVGQTDTVRQRGQGQQEDPGITKNGEQDRAEALVKTDKLGTGRCHQTTPTDREDQQRHFVRSYLYATYLFTLQKQRFLKMTCRCNMSSFPAVPVYLGPHSLLLIGPWLCQASRESNELIHETTPRPARLSTWAGCDLPPPPPPLHPHHLPLWKTHTNVKLSF